MPECTPDKEVQRKIDSFATYAEMMPGVVVIHQLQPFTPCYMTSRGMEMLGINRTQLMEIGMDYHKKFFNNEDMEDFLEKFNNLLKEKDPKETFTFFQQVRIKDRKDWVWHVSSSRIFLQDENGSPTHIVTIALPIDKLHHIPNKAQRLLAENEFFRTNLKKYVSLGKRGKEVLKLVALGKSSGEIAYELNISVDTVNTHRKLIKQKLNITTNYDFMLYAQAFDLI